MLKKIHYAAPIVLVMLCLSALASCSSEAAIEVDQSITPHDVVLKVISELGYGPADFYGSPDSEAKDQTIFEYYSEGSGDYVMDDDLFDIMLGAEAADLTLDMIDRYSVIMFDKDLSVPFELIIFKLPKTDGKTDSGLINKVKQLFSNTLNQHKVSMKDYFDEYIPYAEKAKIKVTDNFVYYCMADKSSKVTTAVYNFLAGK